MTINLAGTYFSESGEYILDITESISSLSQFKGTFTAKSTPEGEVVYPINNNGDAGWFYTSDQHHAGIGFMVLKTLESTADRQFVLFDCWAGTITATNDLVMSGSRSYTKNRGEYGLYTFNNVKFTKK